MWFVASAIVTVILHASIIKRLGHKFNVAYWLYFNIETDPNLAKSVPPLHAISMEQGMYLILQDLDPYIYF